MQAQLPLEDHQKPARRPGMSSFTPRGGYFDRYSGLFPPTIKWLLIINAAMYFVPQMVFVNNLDTFHRILGLVPALVWGKGFIWQLVSYMFLHGSFWHLVMNMFILWMFGAELERTWGSREFTKFYFVAGIGAGVINVIFALLRPNMANVPIIGASGAIYGLLVAYAMLFPERYVYIYFLIPVKVKYLVIFLVGLEFFSTYQPDGVAHFAHLGGALVGFLYLKYDFRWRLARWSPLEYYHRIKAEALAKKRQESLNMMDEVDVILDKINQVGYDNLTKREKKILEKASDRLSNHEQK
jgi:membrane associated rhomboid family serine protease